MIGMPGCGKTYFGKKLADELHRIFIDLDEVIEQKEQKSITQLFDTDGETYFRKQESDLLKNITTHTTEPTVISVGGGTPCFYNNMEWMKQNGITVYLKASIQTILKNLNTNNTHRPLLSNDISTEQILSDLLSKRANYFEQADYNFEVEHLTIEHLTNILL